MQYRAVFNRDGGTFRTMDIEAFAAEAERVFAAAGHGLDCRMISGPELIAALEQAAADEAVEALLVGGGDGTISAAAGIAFRSGKPLAVLPAGTMNLFARSLGVPLALEAALAALAGGVVRPADIATANGTPFVHQFSVGIHAKLVRIRETLAYRSRWGKMAASVRACLLALTQPPNFNAEIRTERGLESRRVSGVFVSNNLLAEGHAPHADRLDTGLLGIYVARPMSPWEMLRLAFWLLAGRWKASPHVIERASRHVVLSFPRRRSSSQAVLDGELVKLARRVEVDIHPGALQVVVPAPE
jgi:diacylglycerol kinase family enzyme